MAFFLVANRSCDFAAPCKPWRGVGTKQKERCREAARTAFLPCIAGPCLHATQSAREGRNKHTAHSQVDSGRSRRTNPRCGGSVLAPVGLRRPAVGREAWALGTIVIAGRVW